MTGRFSRLEFGDREESHERSRPLDLGTPVRTADHFAAQALEAHQHGRFETALQLYTRALREDRARIPAWVGQVQMLVELREYAEGRMWSDKALELFKGNGDLLSAKAQACLRDGDPKTAAASTDAAFKSPGTSPWRWIIRGEVMLTQAAARSRDCFERALAEAGADWFDRITIARVCLHHGRAAAAVEFAQQAAEMRPAHAFCWLTLGECQQQLGFADRARQSVRRALELKPGFEPARELLEFIDADVGRTRFFRRLRGWLRQ